MSQPPDKTDWCKAYWDLMYNRLYSPEPMYSLIHENDQLKELNVTQAARIMELELMVSCIRRVGDGVHIDNPTMQRVYRFYPDMKRFLKGLASSKWARSPNEQCN